jgi:hypothetical protein
MAENVESIVAEGPLSIPRRRLVELLADSPTFCARVAAVTSETPIARIHHPCLPIDLTIDDAPRPLAVVFNKRFGMRRLSVNHFGLDGCTLGLLVSDWDEHPKAQSWGQTVFENFLGMIIKDLADLQGRDGRLCIDTLTMDLPAQRSHPRSDGQGKPYWDAIVEIAVSRV